MPKYCNSCGTTNNDNITNCVNCGAALDNATYTHLGANDDPYIYEPSFGQNNYYQPYPQYYPDQYQTPYYRNYPTANANYFSQPTSTLGWVGWILADRLFPFIGCLIMLFVSKDQSAKNYAKANLAITAVSAVLVALFSIMLFSNSSDLDKLLREIFNR